MNNEIQVANSNLSTVATPQMVIHNSGDNVTQIANNQGGIVNVYQPSNNNILYNASTQISKEYYNLFVVGGDPSTDSFFLVEKDRALTVSEGVVPEISAQFAALTPEAIATIKTFPSIIASLNHQFGRTDSAHNAVFGMVTDIAVLENGIRICIHPLCYIPQQCLNEMASSLAIHTASGLNELNRTHWAIKQINLVDELRCAGFNLPIPT